MKQILTKIEALREVEETAQAIHLLRSLLKFQSQIIATPNIHLKLVSTFLLYVIPNFYHIDDITKTTDPELDILVMNNNSDWQIIGLLIVKNLCTTLGINSLFSKISESDANENASGNNIFKNSNGISNIKERYIHILLRVLFEEDPESNVLCRYVLGDISFLNRGVFVVEDESKTDTSEVTTFSKSNSTSYRQIEIKTNTSQLQKIFFGSRLHSELCHYAATANVNSTLQTLLSNAIDIEKYSHWLTEQYFVLLKYNSLIDLTQVTLSFASLNESNTRRFIIRLLADPDVPVTEFQRVYDTKFTMLNKLRFIQRHVMSLLTTLKVTKGLYPTQIYVVNYCLKIFGFLKIQDFENIMFQGLFKKFNLIPHSTSVLLFHSIVLCLKSGLENDGEFFQKFKGLICNYWANKSFVENASIDVQEALYLFLMIYLNYIENDTDNKKIADLSGHTTANNNLITINKEFLTELQLSEEVISSVGIHLESPIRRIRCMGMSLIEKLTKNGPRPMDFKIKEVKQYAIEMSKVKDIQSIEMKSIDGLCSMIEPSNYNSSVFVRLYFEKLDEGKLILKSDENRRDNGKLLIHETNDKVSKLNTNFTELTLAPSLAVDPYDSDDEDYQDPTLAKQNNTMPSIPIYLKDFYTYLTGTSKQEDQYRSKLKLKIALENLPRALRVKYQVTNQRDEIRFWSEKLTAAIMNTKLDNLVTSGAKTMVDPIRNKQVVLQSGGSVSSNKNGVDLDHTDIDDEEEQFEKYSELKIAALVSLCVVYKERTPRQLVELLISGDYSIHDRLLLINCIGLLARELRGYQDETNLRNLQVQAGLKSFSTGFSSAGPVKQLPGIGHKKFLMLDENFSTSLVTTSRENSMLVLNSTDDDLQSTDGSQQVDLPEAHRLDHITQQIDQKIDSTNREYLQEKSTTGDGTVTRISARLLKQRREQKQSSTNNGSSTEAISKGRFNSAIGFGIDNYSSNCFEDYIAPFLHIWEIFNGDTRTLGSYTNSVLTCYLKNLSVLVHCAYPLSTSIVEIVAAVLEVVNSLRSVVTANGPGNNNFRSLARDSGLRDSTVAERSGLFEGQMYLLLCVLQNTPESVLKHNFGVQLAGVASWLTNVFENYGDFFGDEQVYMQSKALLANCLLRLGEVL